MTYSPAPQRSLTSFCGLSILVCLKDQLGNDTTTSGRFSFTDPANPTVTLLGPSTYQMNLVKVEANIAYAIVHSAPEKLHVHKELHPGVDPNSVGDSFTVLDQNGATVITGTASYCVFSSLITDLVMVISEEINTDLLGISVYQGFGNTSIGPQLSADALGMDAEKLTHRWVSFAGYPEETTGLLIVLGLRVQIGNSASFGSTERMALYKLVFDPESVGDPAVLISVEEVTATPPFEPHTLRLISFRDIQGKKRKRWLALGKAQPERYANNLNDDLLEVLEGRTVTTGLGQLGGVGVWYTDDLEGLTDWTLLYQPEIGDVEVPSEQGSGYAVARPTNFDIGLDYDRTWQRILCVGIGEDASRPSLRGRVTFVEP